MESGIIDVFSNFHIAPFDKQDNKLQFVMLSYHLIYPTLTGSKNPTSRFERSKEDKWEITARKDPISLANHQWGMKKTPTDGSITLWLFEKQRLDRRPFKE